MMGGDETAAESLRPPADAERPDSAPSEDDLDRQLIAALQADGRLTNTALSRRFGVSESVVRQRLKRLHDAQAVRSSAIANPTLIGLTHVAMVRLRVAPPAIDAILRKLVRLPNFQYIAVTSGAYNVLAFSATESAQELSQVLDAHLRPDAEVRRIDVRPVVSAPIYDVSYEFM